MLKKQNRAKAKNRTADCVSFPGRPKAGRENFGISGSPKGEFLKKSLCFVVLDEVGWGGVTGAPKARREKIGVPPPQSTVIRAKSLCFEDIEHPLLEPPPARRRRVGGK